MSSDAIVLLREDHKELKRLFREFKEAGPNAHATKGRLVDPAPVEKKERAPRERRQGSGRSDSGSSNQSGSGQGEKSGDAPRRRNRSRRRTRGGAAVETPKA